MWMDISTCIKVDISIYRWMYPPAYLRCVWIYPHHISKGRWMYPYTGGCIHLSILGQVDISTSMCGYIHLIFPRLSGYIHIQVDVSTCLFNDMWIYPLFFFFFAIQCIYSIIISCFLINMKNCLFRPAKYLEVNSHLWLYLKQMNAVRTCIGQKCQRFPYWDTSVLLFGCVFLT